MKKVVLLMSLFGLCACATPLPQVNFLWQGKSGEAARHFGSPEKAQAALDRDVQACNFELRHTASGDVAEETGLSKACMAAKGWMPES